MATKWNLITDEINPVIDKRYQVKLDTGEITEDIFTGTNWYYYDYTEVVAWRELIHK